MMHQQFNIQQLYALPAPYLCVLYLILYFFHANVSYLQNICTNLLDNTFCYQSILQPVSDWLNGHL